MNFWSFASAICGVGLFEFVKFLIERFDKKHDRLSSVEKRLDEIDKGQCRTQMLLLIADYPTENAEIMKIAEHYFKPNEVGGLGGDWYMSNLFYKWLTQQNLGKPEWFNLHD